MRRFIVFALVIFVVLSLHAFEESFPFGMNNTAYGIFSDTTGKYDEFKRKYKKTMDFTANELGIGWWRALNKFRWGDIQPNCTTWIWDEEDSLVKWAGERGMHILPVFGYTAKWAGNPKVPPEYRSFYPPTPLHWNDYKEYVRRLVERYDGDGVDDYKDLINPIKYWEFMNEPSGKYFYGTSEQYIEMLDSARVAMKSADSTAKIGGPCINTPLRETLHWTYYDTSSGKIQSLEIGWSKMLEAIVNSIGRDNIDFITQHIYMRPVSFMNKLRKIERISGEIPLWITECGYTWYKWSHEYTHKKFYDTFISDTIWITNNAVIYFPDTTTDPYHYSPMAQAKYYSQLLDSLFNYLKNSNKSKFFFHCMNVQTLGQSLSYDRIYRSCCVEGTLCTLYVSKLTVRYPLRERKLGKPHSLLRFNLSPLPAYDTIFNEINIASDIDGLKCASGPKIAIDGENFYLVHKNNGQSFVRISQRTSFWDKKELFSTLTSYPSIFVHNGKLYLADVCEGDGYFYVSDDGGRTWSDKIPIKGADNVTSPIHITSTPLGNILFTFINGDSLRVTKYNNDNGTQNIYIIEGGRSLANPMTLKYLLSGNIWEECYIYEHDGTIKMKAKGSNLPESISEAGSSHSPYAVEGFNNFYVVWVNATDSMIKFRKYSNCGWGEIQNVATLNSTDEKVQPTIVVYSDGIVGVVWSDFEASRRNIYLSESEGSWSNKIQLSSGSKDYFYPVTCFKDSIALVAYVEGTTKPLIRYHRIK